MATGDTAPPPLTIQPPPIEPLSDDDNSSPLSDVEEKDTDPDDLHDLHNLHGLHRSLAHGRDHEVSSAGDLSDANDTEAETERLYDTPQKPSRQKDVVLSQSAEGQVYERTPSKLRQHQTTVEDDDDDDDEPLSDEDVSMSSSPPAQETKPPEKLQSPTLDILAEAANQEAENRKRKRSMPTESEPQEPLRKRNGSVPAQGRQQPGGDTTVVDDDGPSSNTQSGEHSADEARTKTTGAVKQSEPVDEAPSDHEAPPPKLTRSGSKKKKGSEDVGEAKKHSSEARDRVDAEEEHVHTGEEETIVDEVDEEAEAAHKNEEERMADLLISPKRTSANNITTVERKRAAYEQLTGIEKRFATFRDRLYEERLQQLNEEEAMLRSDNPTHPEYLAMMQCIDARRDDRVRVADKELELNMESLGRWAVARRTQIHSQYFQAVRESRERVLAELGQQWYDIQNERRKHANNVPEFGLRFPPTQTQRVKNALAYNKEVSILSGVAKYEGMPAAPDMKGASMQELEDDFEAMNRTRRPASQPAVRRSNYGEYGGLPFGQGLGPAGAQFLEQTPWANPNHPSNAHLLQRQQPAHNEIPKSVPNNTVTPKRQAQSHQPNPFSSGTISNSSSHGHPFQSSNSNGNTKSHKHIPRPESTSPEVTRAASLLEQTSARSIKAAAVAAAAAAVTEAPRDSPVKRENMQPIGGM
ncbi:Transcriptional regulatory protein [Diatrype stigma]|uniref:Transcriptional regulatory protein n=1 Tax=Diatrype stigma TaxID=117547 RepID=A0AAN9V408_9PEZI